MEFYPHIPRLTLAQLPTPLYRLENASAALSRNLYVKRDDMTGVALGGNKVRKLEYLLSDAIRLGCDTVITTGGAQSNHAMLTAACAKKLSLTPYLVLKGRGVCEKKGNLLLSDLMGVDVRLVDTDSFKDVYTAMEELKETLLAAGKKPYLIPVGGSVPLGALGYVRAVLEAFTQMKEMGVMPDRIVFATGSGGMHAGVALGALLYGERFFGKRVHATGIAVSDEPFREIVTEIVLGAAALLGEPVAFTQSDVELYDYTGAGYAIPSEQGSRAIRLMAAREGLFLDPVYTGKAFGGLMDLCEKGVIGKKETVLFIHSGGAGGLFAIEEPRKG
ncbi:MAG: D-cysteine desulfhydrase family protein [Clostridiaceae bacterium]|nr:D-cysteine desulfhydrase family protein [Eubacteriales bacterium]